MTFISQPLKEPIVVKPHPGGKAGAMMSLDEVAKKAWASRNDPRVRAWATDKLVAAGNPPGARDKMQVILDAFRKQVHYVSDPVQTEAMYGAVQTLCLDDQKALCMRGADCDDQSIAYGAALMSVGIPVQVVGASYKDPTDLPVHVYIQAQDDAGQWVPIDPTTKYEVGSVHPPARTWIVDPNKGVGAAGLPGGDFVGVGRAPERSEANMLSIRGRQFGLGIVTPTNILSYRNAWNQYVVDTVSVAQGCAAAYASTAATQTDATTKAELTGIGQAIQAQATALLAQWNVYANVSDATIVLQGASILQSFQQTVLSAGQVRENVSTGALACAPTYVNAAGVVTTWAPGVDPSVQVQIISTIEGLGILASGVLQILLQTTGNSLQAVGSAAQWAARQANNVTKALGSTGLWVGVTAVAAAVIVYEVWPKR